MTDLETKLNTILNDKLTNLKPENLKKGVTLLGVKGTLEASSSNTVKLFATKEEMQTDSEATDGDLAVVYKSDIQNMTSDQEVTSITFPETVTLPQAYTSDSYCMIRATDSSVAFDGQIILSQTTFDFRAYSDSEITVEYESEDGITYTRTQMRGSFGDLTNPVDLGTTVKVETISQWDDNFGYFMQIQSSAFAGLYQCKYTDDVTNVKCIDASKSTITIVYTDDYITLPEVSLDDTLKYYGIAITSVKKNVATDYTLYKSNYPIEFATNQDGTLKFILCAVYSGTSATVIEETYVDKVLQSSITHTTSENVLPKVWSDSTSFYYTKILSDEVFYSNHSSFLQNYTTSSTLPFAGGMTAGSNQLAYSYSQILQYFLAPTQLTTTTNDVYLTEFYGKNGIETGTLTENVSNSFADISAEIYDKIQKAYATMEPRVLTSDDQNVDKNIYFIPVNAKGQPLLDTSALTGISFMFSNCTNLVTIPLLDTSNVTSMARTFEGCKNLTTIAQLDTSKVTSMVGIFNICPSLTAIPLFDTSKVTSMQEAFQGCSSLTAVPLLDTSKVTYMTSMFRNCTSLVTVPLLDTSSVINISNAFANCTSLSDDSLNNILAMCTNATAYKNTKTLKYIGLTEEQATKCTTLSNYSAFTSAGWTTGY